MRRHSATSFWLRGRTHGRAQPPGGEGPPHPGGSSGGPCSQHWAGPQRLRRRHPEPNASAHHGSHGAASQGAAGGGHMSWCSQGRVCPWDQGRSLHVGGCTELSAPHSRRALLLSKGRPSRYLSSQGSSRTLGTEKTLCTAHVWTRESLSVMSQPGNLSWALVCPHVACRKVPDVGQKGPFATSRSGFSNFF